MTASGELAGCIRWLGAGRVSQHSSDFHTFEPGGGGGGSGGSLAGDFGGSCFPRKGHLSPWTELGGWRRRRESGTGLGWVGGIIFFYNTPPPPELAACGWHRYVAGWRVK